MNKRRKRINNKQTNNNDEWNKYNMKKKKK